MFILKVIFLCILQKVLSDIPHYSKSDFENTEVKKTISLQNKIIKIETEAQITNKNTETANFYRYVISKNNTSTMLYIKFELKDSNEEYRELKYLRFDTNDEYIIYDLQLGDLSMHYGETKTLKVIEDHFDKLEFYPKKIMVKDNQQAYYMDILNYYSAYPTTKQSTIIILPDAYSSVIGQRTSSGRASNKEKERVTYTINEEIDALKAETFYIHYVYTVPFVVMNYAHREYRISHWGNIAVNENYQLANIGAKLDGEFSRIDYDEYRGYGGRNALKNLEAILPMRANGLWYRDEIGNVSTSEASRQWDNVKLELHPRFPILGGWKSNFDIGYNLPTKFNVKKKEENGNDYMFNLTFGMPFSDILARNYSVKVVLPEGAENIKVHLPLDSEAELETVKEYGLLDLQGRPAVIIKMKNVYDRHHVYFQVFYTFSKFSLASKAIVLVFYFLLIFTALIIYFRANWSLSPKEEEQKLKKD
ncbi:MAG: dolichyl-diphosphooligosaccharide--protein glycosyltransferase subunit 1 [archaeon]|nr:dolichyl-diphosphooligosaccharide--protein glycosyltransferase subunit 1 [archaeon]